MKLFYFLTFLLFMSCERHQMESKIVENELVVGEELTFKESLQKAFLESDYDVLEQQFEIGADVDTIFSDGKTMLFLSVEAQDYKMADFLIRHKANASLNIESNGVTLTVMELADSIDQEDRRKVLLHILENKLDQVSEHIFYDTVNTISSGESFDLRWIQRLITSGMPFDGVTESLFLKTFIKKASLADNFNEFIKLLLDYRENIDIANWQSWVEKPFSHGRYSRAKCTFVTDNKCYSFDQFLDSCDGKMRKKLEKAKTQIMTYLTIRNEILICTADS